MNKLIVSNITDPWHNLALEDYLFDSHDTGFTLYLWQNQNTVVIGRNQNAWKECRYELLEQDGGRLARRQSGGGAVFHDLGNLNFTFVAPRKGYDVQKQLEVVVSAVKSLGVNARFTGRNDILAYGKTGEAESEAGAKFSGNAFRLSNKAGLHHGTLLVRADMTKLAKYLVPSVDKLKAKGVASVRARVCNLSDFAGRLSIDDVKRAVTRSFIELYGAGAAYELSKAELEEVALRYEKHASRQWRLSDSPAFDLELGARLSFGGIELHMSFLKGRIVKTRVFTDAMDETLAIRLEKALEGCAFERGAMAAAVRALSGAEAAEVAAWLMEGALHA